MLAWIKNPRPPQMSPIVQHIAQDYPHSSVDNPSPFHLFQYGILVTFIIPCHLIVRVAGLQLLHGNRVIGSPKTHGVAINMDLLGTAVMFNPSPSYTLAIQTSAFLQLFGHPIVDVSMILCPSITTHDIYA
uniref:Uncharacterized protein n=1 Tax=Anguilla anguilla TaxID=7936 RepID=A0A0E9X2X7_ANGAN